MSKNIFLNFITLIFLSLTTFCKAQPYSKNIGIEYLTDDKGNIIGQGDTTLIEYINNGKIYLTEQFQKVSVGDKTIFNKSIFDSANRLIKIIRQNEEAILGYDKAGNLETFITIGHIQWGTPKSDTTLFVNKYNEKGLIVESSPKKRRGDSTIYIYDNKGLLQALQTFNSIFYNPAEKINEFIYSYDSLRNNTIKQVKECRSGRITKFLYYYDAKNRVIGRELFTNYPIEKTDYPRFSNDKAIPDTTPFSMEHKWMYAYSDNGLKVSGEHFDASQEKHFVIKFINLPMPEQLINI